MPAWQNLHRKSWLSSAVLPEQLGDYSKTTLGRKVANDVQKVMCMLKYAKVITVLFQNPFGVAKHLIGQIQAS